MSQLRRYSGIVCLFYICLIEFSDANKTLSNGTATNATQVPVLDLKQILALANPDYKAANETASTVPASTTVKTTTSIPLLTPSFPTTTTTTPSTTTVSTTTPSTTTPQPSSISVEVVTSVSSQTTIDYDSIVVTETPKTTEDVQETTAQSSSPPEALRESTVAPVETTQPSTTTTTAKPEIVLGPIVKLPQGDIRPSVERSRGGKKYYAFRGVRYAAPPTYFQRFKEPAPAAPWSEVFNATTYGPSCIQYNVLTGKVEGEEDCLTLNIFTNKLPGSSRSKKRGQEPYPVMVFFHQGAFMFGTSGDFEEKYMMDEPVVLVTVNYRLGAFGFLNTQGDSDAKGNQGLKDQLLALKFIRDNINLFNGEPNSVTLFGESAGGASVHYHLLSDKSRGLFHRAISQSGTALSPWAFTRAPKKMAKKLGTLLNCPTRDMNELFTCLQGHDARVIADKTKEFYVWNIDPVTPFGPSIEAEETTSSFLTESPYTYMKTGRINDGVPWMLGVVENVCLLDAWSVLVDKQLREDINVDWHRIAPTSFWYAETALEPDAVSNQVKAYYFGTKEIGNETAQDLEHLYSDRYFNHGIRTSALTHVRKYEASPVYLYLFSYKGTQSHTKFAGISDVIGVSEGDDLQYLFNTKRFKEITVNSTEAEFSQRLIKLWVSFAKEGKPTAVWSKQEWKPISAAQIKGDESLMYYSLNDKCGFVEEPFTSRMNFWDTLPLNENENELTNIHSIHSRYPGEDDDLFNPSG